jgi:HD superfamily phosphohydrolase
MPRTFDQFMDAKKKGLVGYSHTPRIKVVKLRNAARAAIKAKDWNQITKAAVAKALEGDKDARRFLQDVMKDPQEVDEWVRLNDELRKKLQEAHLRITELETEVVRLKAESRNGNAS